MIKGLQRDQVALFGCREHTFGDKGTKIMYNNLKELGILCFATTLAEINKKDT